jgi:quinol-cytochrome oxidoreductase complex cytochrome b subunit/coenzyme F420-reducing hydrogenase delta subunit/ferredoxin
MQPIQLALRRAFAWAEATLDRPFGPAWNPLHNLGALGFFYYWIVAVSGIYLYIGFDTGVARAYDSIEHMTRVQWYLGGIMRSLHRYASDALAAMMLLHVVREFAMDRMSGPRWFTWVTGVPLLWLVYASGISGYWLVWDELAQYVALATTELLDWLPIFGEPIARNFLAPSSLDDRFFTLLIFLHIALPLILLFLLWIHLQRLARPHINPPRGLAIGTLVMLLALSLYKPALSHGPADLAAMPGVLRLDWFYLGLYPLFDTWSFGTIWAIAAGGTLILLVLPWLARRRAAVARVNLEYCNGCARCAADCPYNAVAMVARSDGAPFEQEAQVDPALCVGCGICVGACPTSIPFRSGVELPTGIDLVDPPLTLLRQMVWDAASGCATRPRILVFGCSHGVNAASVGGDQVAVVTLPCIAMLPPSFIDFALSRDLAEGVLLTGCRDEACRNRFGVRWTEDRLAGRRDPYLRARVQRQRVRTLWAGRGEERKLACAAADFAAALAGVEPPGEATRLRAAVEHAVEP